MLNSLVDSVADQDRSTVLPLQTRRQVHAVAQHCIVHALLGADISYDGFARMNAEADGKRRQALRLKLSIESVACRLGRKGRSTWSNCKWGAFQNTITESPINLSTVPPSARNTLVSAVKWRDACRIKLSGSAASAMPVKFVTSVNRTVTSRLTPPSSVEIELSMIPLTISFGTKRAKDQMLRWATAMVWPSSSISATCDVIGISSGGASRRSLPA